MRAHAKSLSFSSVLLLGVNGIIGSGIFLLPGSLYQQAGNWSVLLVILAGIATTLVALNYAVLASKIDEDGGAWVYANRAFGPAVGFQIGWLSWFLGVITISAEIAAFLTTLTDFIPALQQRTWYVVVAVGLIGMLAIINLFGPGTMSVVDNLASALKVLLLLGFIIGGAMTLGAQLPPVITTPATHGQWILALTTSFYMFTGFSFLPTAAKEMQRAERNLPRALLLVMLVVTVIYSLALIVTIGLLGHRLAGETLPVALAFEQVVGPIGKVVILVGMLISILGVAVAVSFDTPVGLASLATEKQLLPAVFGRQNRFQAPVVAVLVTTGLAMLLVVSGDYLFLVNLIVLAAFIQYLVTILASFKLRRDQTLPTGMRLWGGQLVPVLALGIVVGIMLSFQLQTYLIAGGVVVSGIVIYWLDRHQHPH
ncbi:APC family permease [Secundilactobacillus similis]|uniref:Amino acid transporter n=1 Tax=Secundilactobacillus similis DSM 23365 = JCM 2765 TaxID=1423804 RepID=A0A0R2F2J0_9LACO|nr:APC family permease [Secundilactobacillus similis]KRN19306.1 amino acid transporter [Secundilactobacillus similis DSM 23365 = JCM 2765]